MPTDNGLTVPASQQSPPDHRAQWVCGYQLDQIADELRIF